MLWLGESTGWLSKKYHGTGIATDAVDRPVKVIGVDELPINLLKGLTPEVASSFLKSIFMLSEHFHSDPFWIETATALCRNTLGVLPFSGYK